MSFFDRLKGKTPPAQESRANANERIDRLAEQAVARPKDWAIRNDLADALVQAGRIEEAANLLCTIGEQLASQGFAAKAQALYKKVVRLQPHNELAANRVAELTSERINQSARPPGLQFPGAQEPSPAPPADAAPVAGHEPTDATPAMPEELPHAPEEPSPEAPEPVSATTDSAPDASAARDDFAVVPPESIEEPAAETANAGTPVSLPHEYGYVTIAPSDETTAAGEAQAAEAAPPYAERTTVEEALAAAQYEAAQGTLDRAIELLRNCARAFPDRIEPIAMLVEIATRGEAEDVLTQAQARLCDLYWRSGDYENARATAEALAARYPDDPHHRARVDFIVAELAESLTQLTPQETATTEGQVAHEDVEHHCDLDEVSGAAPAVAADEAFLGADARSEHDEHDSGTLFEETRDELERAASDPVRRFAAARQIAHMDIEAGELMSALGWLEWAAGGMPTAEQEEELAYDMGVLLERAGEVDRALGVYQEIAAKAGADYRDVSERIRQLSYQAGR